MHILRSAIIIFLNYILIYVTGMGDLIDNGFFAFNLKNSISNSTFLINRMERQNKQLVTQGGGELIVKLRDWTTEKRHK